jgi:hypothetical protein
VLHAPRFEATLVSIDAAKAEAMRGVKVVRDGDFAGVVSSDSYAAQQAIEALAQRRSGTNRRARRRTRRSSNTSRRTRTRPRSAPSRA